MKEILNVIHNTIYQFIDVCSDDEEVPMSDKDKLLLEVNKAICNNLKAREQQPCEDCISRAGALRHRHLIYDDDGIGYSVVRVDEIMALPSVTSQPRWIPVSERLPEEYLCNDGYIEPSDYVLVWGDHGNYSVSRYWGNRRSKSESPNTYKDWVDLDWVVQKPVAWMPLPEPYKAESEDER